MLADPRR